MKDTLSEDYQRIVDEINHYIQLQKRLLLLKTIKNSSNFLTIILIIAITLVMCSFIVLLLTFALAYFIADILGSFIWGFVISAFINVLILLLLILLRKQIITDRIIRTMIHSFIDTDE